MEPTLESLSQKIDALTVSVEKVRRYMFYTFVVTVVAILLPIAASVLIIPFVLSQYTSSLETLVQ